jgi:hypothetical protein
VLWPDFDNNIIQAFSRLARQRPQPKIPMKNNKNAPAGIARLRGRLPFIASFTPYRNNTLHTIKRYEATICAIAEARRAFCGSATCLLNILLASSVREHEICDEPDGNRLSEPARPLI